MKLSTLSLTPLLRLMVLAAAFSITAVHADDYSEVNQLIRSGKMTEALNKADQYLATKPRDPQMRFIKGVIQRETGKVSEALSTFTKLTEDYPELPEPYNNLAVLYASQNQFDKARSALELAIRTNPSYATAHENLGDVYARLASQAYNKALQLDGNNAAVPPKMALIRELFNPAAKGQRPVTTVTASPKPEPAAAKPDPVAIKPASATFPLAANPASSAGPVTEAAPKVAAPSGTTAEVQDAVQAWARAWASKDVSSYLAAYGKAFDPPGAQSRSTWEEERRKRITGKKSITVRLDNLTVSTDSAKAVAKFKQVYKADSLSVSSRKTLDLVKTGDRWLIIRESTGN
jgi:Flp pilus assembly protein TadD/ketosteroid isomerase-like protein